MFGLDAIQLGKENYSFLYGTYIGSANTPSFTSAYADFGMLGFPYALILGGMLRTYDNTMKPALQSVNSSRVHVLSAYVCSLILVLKLNVTVIGSALLGEGLLASMLISYLVTGYHPKKITMGS